MSDIVIGASLEVESGRAEGSVKSFREQLKQAQYDAIAISEKFGLTSKEAAEAAKKVALLKDQMGDAKALVDAFNPDRKFAAFSMAIRGVTNGFTAMQGVMGLVGQESEDLQKTLVKVQSALALSEGVNGLLEMKDGFKIVQAAGVNAFNKIKTAIGSTGIGLILVAIGTLVAYWDEIKEFATGVSDEMKDQNEQAKKNLALQQEKLKTIGDQDNILKLQGKSEREILQIKTAQVDEAIKAAEVNIASSKQLKEAQVAAATRNKSILKGILDFVTLPLQALIDGVTKVANFFGSDWKRFDMSEEIATLVFDPADVAAEGDAAIKEAETTLLNLKNQRAGYQLAVRDIDQKAHDDKMAALRDRAKAEEDEIERLYQESLKNAEKRKSRGLNEGTASGIDPDAAVRIDSANQGMNDKLASAGAAFTMGGLTPEQFAEKNELLKQLLLTESQIKLDALNSEYARKFELIKGNEDAELALKQWYSESKQAIDDAETQNKIQNMQKVSSLLGNAASLFGKHTAAYKILATSQAIIDTYTSANAAYKAMAGIPVVGPVLGAAAAGVAIAAGLKNIKEINKVKVPGADGGSAPSISAPPAPIQPQVQTTTLNQNQVNQIGNAAAGGVGRAYVLNGDIQNAQQRDNAIQRAATLG